MEKHFCDYALHVQYCHERGKVPAKVILVRQFILGTHHLLCIILSEILFMEKHEKEMGL